MPIPVTLDDAKRQIRVELDDDERDEEIVSFINDAAAWIEEYTGHVLVARDVTAEFDAFGSMAFREWPIAANAVPVVSYVGAGGNVWPVTAVRVNIARRPVRISSWVGEHWPSLPARAAITATVRAGYEDGDAVPGVIRRVMLMLIAAYDDDREGGAAFQKAEETARALCRGLRPRSV